MLALFLLLVIVAIVLSSPSGYTTSAEVCSPKHRATGVANVASSPSGGYRNQPSHDQFT